MLPLQLIVGFVLGLSAAARRRAGLDHAVVAGVVTLGWGALTAANVHGSGDSDWWTGLVGGSLLAAANVVVGAGIGAAVGWATISRGGRRTRRPSR